MRYCIVLFLCFSTLLSAQSRKDMRKYDDILILIEDGYLEDAKIEAASLIEKTDGWKRPYFLMYLIYKKEGKIFESADAYLKVYDIHSKSNSYAISLLAKLFYENGYYLEALKYFKISDSLSVEKNKYERFILSCKFSIASIDESLNDGLDFMPENMGESINSEYAEYLPAISSDGKNIIITRRIEGNSDKLQEDLFSSYKAKNGIWDMAIPMSINTDRNEGSVSVSPDGKFLTFTACHREDGFGSCDIYLSVKRNGVWSKPSNIGSRINTRYWESQAVFSPDGRYLYFVSNRRGGFGGNDIWVSEITRFGFSDPVNLGSVINTEKNEMSPFLHSDNLSFYFASEGHVGMGGFDLFLSRRSDADKAWSQPENLGYPINSHKTENSLVVDPDGLTAYFTSDNSGFGLEDIFFFELPAHYRANKISDLEMEIITQEKGSEIILENVLFETDSDILQLSSYDELFILLTYLKKNPSIYISIEGHTDNQGTETYNLNLSNNRAKNVYNYLIENGISKDRLQYQGYGESRPIANNNTIKGRGLNRRTSFVITE